MWIKIKSAMAKWVWRLLHMSAKKNTKKNKTVILLKKNKVWGKLKKVINKERKKEL